MQAPYTIGELAKAAGVRDSTVRYYERRELLAPRERTSSNYRIYGEEELHRLRFIRAAQDTGFRLEDIRLLLDLRDGSGDPCGEVKALLRERLGAVTDQLQSLQDLRQVIVQNIARCEATEGSSGCQVIEDLEERSAR